MKTKIADKLTSAEKAIRDFALKLPGATEEFPWGSRAFKVGGKAFVFLSNMEGVISTRHEAAEIERLRSEAQIRLAHALRPRQTRLGHLRIPA